MENNRNGTVVWKSHMIPFSIFPYYFSKCRTSTWHMRWEMRGPQLWGRLVSQRLVDHHCDVLDIFNWGIKRRYPNAKSGMTWSSVYLYVKEWVSVHSWPISKRPVQSSNQIWLENSPCLDDFPPARNFQKISAVFMAIFAVFDRGHRRLGPKFLASLGQALTWAHSKCAQVRGPFCFPKTSDPCTTRLWWHEGWHFLLKVIMAQVNNWPYWAGFLFIPFNWCWGMFRYWLGFTYNIL